MPDTHEIGDVSLRLMQQVIDAHPNSEVGEVAIAVEIIHGDGTSTVETAWSGNRPLVALALFTGAQRAMDKFFE